MRILILTLAAALTALAGDTDTPHLIAEKKTLTLSGAKAVAAAAVAEARRLNAPGAAIAVVDSTGSLLYLERLDGTFPAGATISTGKARSAALFLKPTIVFENAIRNGRTPLLGVDVLTPLEGGVPVVSAGQIVGAIGVSGAATADQDEQIARAGAAGLQ